MSAPLSARMALRFGTGRVVAAGLASMSAGFWWASTLDASTPYWGPVVGQVLLLGAGLTMTSAPATEAILGALPRSKAGVGSAVNDTTRELGGTLGVAVVGSVVASLYGPGLVDGLAGLPVPPEALVTARSSVQGAVEVAARAPEIARPVIPDAARTAFLDGLAAGVTVAAVLTALASLAAARFLPSQAAPHGGPDVLSEPGRPPRRAGVAR